MKTFQKLLTCIPLLLPAAGYAHGGHMLNESAHGFLHVEHIILLALIGGLILLHHLRGK